MTGYDLKHILAEELARVVPGEAGKRRTRFDYVLPGFGERIHRSGRKSYVLQRTIGGKQRLITIGDAAILTERIAKERCNAHPILDKVLLEDQYHAPIGKLGASDPKRKAPNYARLLDFIERSDTATRMSACLSLGAFHTAVLGVAAPIPPWVDRSTRWMRFFSGVAVGTEERGGGEVVERAPLLPRG